MERLKYRRGILQVDALEKRAKEILGQVHSLRDSVRPVNRLPPEVLASCATFVSDADPPIIPLTHVCQYWRESIVSNPGNWKSLGIAWERLVSLCIGRAGAVPLILDVTVSNNKGNKGFLDGLLPQSPGLALFVSLDTYPPKQWQTIFPDFSPLRCLDLPPWSSSRSKSLSHCSHPITPQYLPLFSVSQSSGHSP